MEDSMFTTKEILKRISKEEKHIKKCSDEILKLKYEISATERAIVFWKKQLKLAEKREHKQKI